MTESESWSINTSASAGCSTKRSAIAECRSDGRAGFAGNTPCTWSSMVRIHARPPSRPGTGRGEPVPLPDLRGERFDQV